jgi:hypothetical protein
MMEELRVLSFELRENYSWLVATARGYSIKTKPFSKEIDERNA